MSLDGAPTGPGPRGGAAPPAADGRVREAVGAGLALALDTSARMASVAIGDARGTLAASDLPLRVSRAEAALPEIDRLLAACGRTPADLETVVVGSGPGSFTGTRTAAALAKGICFARGLPLYAYSSLAAVAAGTGLAGRVCAVADARRGQVYAAAYRSLEPLATALEPSALTITQLLEDLPPSGGWTYAGEGALRHAETIGAAGGRVLGAHLAAPRAAALLWLARTQPRGGRVPDPRTWEPIYVREAVTGPVRATRPATARP